MGAETEIFIKEKFCPLTPFKGIYVTAFDLYTHWRHFDMVPYEERAHHIKAKIAAANYLENKQINIKIE